ncbi:hypothetical protein MXD62_06955 [Frankia sp. Mgl5]|nr:hypothetical protein [Frankia sp. Mgl5]MCK9926907.1 hypothetical protein [Frankia sp. Mgl5]
MTEQDRRRCHTGAGFGGWRCAAGGSTVTSRKVSTSMPTMSAMLASAASSARLMFANVARVCSATSSPPMTLKFSSTGAWPARKISPFGLIILTTWR